MFSSYEPDHPAEIHRQITGAQEEIAMIISRYFDKGGEGYSSLERIRRGEIDSKEGAKIIKEMIAKVISSIPKEWC